MKIGIFSGTFDPLHIGHIDFAQQALEQGLDKVVFMPEKTPRRKTNISEISHRKKILELSIKDIPDLEIYSPVGHDTYTISKTLDNITNKYGANNELWLLMGADVFEFIEKWGSEEQNEKSSVEFMKNAYFFVALREEDDGETAVKIRDKLNIEVKMASSNNPHVSSSKIRNVIMHGNKPVGLSEEALNYIEKNGLYKAKS